GYELRHLTTGDYYLGISLSRSPTLQNPYTRWFYPGAEDPALAGILHVSDRPEVQRFDLTLPAKLHERAIQGAVFWPDGRPAEGVNIFLEDPRWAWQTFTVAATTDHRGHFTTHGLDGTRYRVHAVGVAGVLIPGEPVPIEPGANPAVSSLPPGLRSSKVSSLRNLRNSYLTIWFEKGGCSVDARRAIPPPKILRQTFPWLFLYRLSLDYPNSASP